MSKGERMNKLLLNSRELFQLLGVLQETMKIFVLNHYHQFKKIAL